MPGFGGVRGVISGSIVSNGGLELVGNGMTGISNTVLSGGLEFVSFDSFTSPRLIGPTAGATSGDIISSGGLEFVDQGGIASGTIVSTGGTLIVLSGAAALGTVNAGGNVSSSGVVVLGANNQLVTAGDVVSGAVIGSGGQAYVGSGGILSSASIAGTVKVESGGTLNDATLAGTLVLSGGTAAVTGVLNLQGSAVISALAGPVASFGSTIYYAFNSGAGIQAVVSGFTSANTIITPAPSGATLASSFVSGNTVVTVAQAGSPTFGIPDFTESFTFAGSYTSGYFMLGSSGGFTTITANGTPCYCPGTLIETATGETPVENLAIGDQVRTAAGRLRPIRWIGRRAYAGRFAAGKPHILPVRIAAGALGEGLPRRDLVVSPLHAMFIDDVLIPAAALVNGTSIVQLQTVERVEYIHIELDSHDVILAEGAPSESFVDDDSRGMFHNAGDYAARYPDAGRRPARYCAPRLEDGPALEKIRQRIVNKAAETLPGPLDGFIDEVTRDRICGWARDRGNAQPVVLHITADGMPLRTVTADSFRTDLLAAGIGNGHHAFDVTIPGGLPSGAAIRIARATDGVALESGMTRAARYG